MLFKQETLEGIAAGEITQAYRRWRRPTVKPGGELKTPIGVLAIGKVEKIGASAITARAAKAAGYSSRESLLKDLSARNGDLYRITFRLAGPDPRDRLRTSQSGVAAEATSLKALDAKRRSSASARNILELIDAMPGERAAELASRVDRETNAFKRDVRRLKELGLTESLETGYRLSPRGRSVLALLRRKD